MQAEIIAELKQKAKQNTEKELDIAVLTPYKAQKKLMEDKVKERELNVAVYTINESQGDCYLCSHITVYYCQIYRE